MKAWIKEDNLFFLASKPQGSVISRLLVRNITHALLFL